MKNHIPARRSADPYEISFGNSSSITAIAKGAHQARQYTFSAYFMDEMAFLEQASEICGGAWPTLFGGGRFTGVSTAHPGFFESIVTAAKKHNTIHHSLMTGMEVWIGQPEQIDGVEVDDPISVLRLHYTADPEESTQRKVAQAKASALRLGRIAWFKKEYEIEYRALSGELVWPEITQEMHMIPPFSPPDDWLKMRVIDPGYRNPTAVNWVALSPPGWRGCETESGLLVPVMVFYREMHHKGLRVEVLAQEIKDRSGLEKYRLDLIDPSADIHRGNELAGRSVMQLYQACGIPVQKANNSVEAGIDEVHRRAAVHGKSPGLLIAENCENTWREILSYRYREMTENYLAQNNPVEAVRKKDDHHPDCVRYLCMANPVPQKEQPKVPPRGTFGYELNQMKKEAALFRRTQQTAYNTFMFRK